MRGRAVRLSKQFPTQSSHEWTFPYFINVIFGVMLTMWFRGSKEKLHERDAGSLAVWYNTLLIVRWLSWKQDLSHINHKRLKLGQDSSKGTEIRQCILYCDTLQNENPPHVIKEPSLLLQRCFLFKVSEPFFSPFWCYDCCWVCVMSAAADHLSLFATISLIMETKHEDWTPALGRLWTSNSYKWFKKNGCFTKTNVFLYLF